MRNNFYWNITLRGEKIFSRARGKKWSFKFQLRYFPASCRQELGETDKLRSLPKIDISSWECSGEAGRGLVWSLSTALRAEKTPGSPSSPSPYFEWSIWHYQKLYPPSPHLGHFILLETAETITSHFSFSFHQILHLGQNWRKKTRIWQSRLRFESIQPPFIIHLLFFLWLQIF